MTIGSIYETNGEEFIKKCWSESEEKERDNEYWYSISINVEVKDPNNKWAFGPSIKICDLEKKEYKKVVAFLRDKKILYNTGTKGELNLNIEYDRDHSSYYLPFGDCY